MDSHCYEQSKSKRGSKVFRVQNSMLTDLFNVNHIRSIYHLSIAILIIFVTRTILQDFLQEGSINLQINLLTWNLRKFHLFVHCWIYMFASITIIFYPIFRHWFARKSMGPEKWAYLAAYVGFILCLLVLPARYVLNHDLPLISTMVLLCEQLRLLMKLHSFVRENLVKLLEYKTEMLKSSPEEKDIQIVEPSFSKFLYFIFAPTLIYRDNYPMTNQISWSAVIHGCLQVFGCLFSLNYIFVRFCSHEFENFDRNRVTFRIFILSWFNCILPGSLCFLLCFFLTLHAWQNVFAELMRFGDRLFYKDWWNAASLSEFYRTWNVIVHDWLHAYVYNDVNLLLGTKNRPLATVAVFCLSAIFHEYIFIFSFRFVYPVLFFEFFALSVPILFMTRSNKGEISNIFFWLGMLPGLGLTLCLYVMEWYARINCPPTFLHYFDYFIPRSWICANLENAI